jgi:Fe-S cluster assembly iron-binding protein IscA
MHTINSLSFHISDKAYNLLTRLSGQQSESVYIRIGSPGKGCIKGKFSVALDSEKLASDRIHECGELKFLVHPSDYMILAGRTLDYIEDISGKRGFQLK